VPNHKGRERESVKTRCLEAVNTYGNSPIKFEKIIKKKKDKKIIAVPGTTRPPKTAISSFISPLIATFALILS
jgi:hypothetical protein